MTSSPTVDAAVRSILRPATDRCREAHPPAGAVLGISTPAGRSVTAMGHRTVHRSDVEPCYTTSASAPMTADTLHDWASVTKVAATTTCLMRLVSAGRMSLDDTVRRYLPDFRGGAKDSTTVRDMLAHRAGLWEWQPLYMQAREPDSAIRLATRLPLRYGLRSGRHYSDIGFILLGELIVRITGLPLDEAVRQLVTEPLGMGATGFGARDQDNVAASALGDRAEMAMVDSGVPYPTPFRSCDFRGWRTGVVVGEPGDCNAHHALGGVAGHAGLFSTVPDMLRLAEALAGYGQFDHLWDPMVVAEFLAPGPDPGQSLGFRHYPVTVHGERHLLLGHPGFVGCAVGFIPGLGAAVALGSNRMLHHHPPLPVEDIWHTARTAIATTLEEERL